MVESGKNKKLFSVRERWKKIRAWDGVLHLFSLAVLVLISLVLYPGSRNPAGISTLQNTSDALQAMEARQQLIEALDKMVRYQNYYKDIHGHFTRDLSRLGLPERLSVGAFENVRRHYEISVLEIGPSRMLLLALGHERGNDRSPVRMDRVTMDERHRLNTNFIAPPPSRAYLYEEADRVLRLRFAGKIRFDSVYSSYWQIENSGDGLIDWVALGRRAPVLGEKRSLDSLDISALKGKHSRTIFDTVSGQIRARSLGGNDRDPAAVKDPQVDNSRFHEEDVRDLLFSAHQAQHIHKQERGHYARRWEDLDGVVGFQFSEKKQKIANIRFQPITLTDGGYRIVVEGTSGELLGEQFQIDQNGSVRQVRYTDALIQQLQQSTEFLENTFKFQISEVPGTSRAAPAVPNAKRFLDRGKARPVKSTDQGSGKTE